MAKAAVAACVLLAALQTSSAQIPLSTSSAYVQNFDAIGTTATASLPTGFKADKSAAVRTVGTYAAALTATSLLGGANLSTTAGNGIYNFGSGTTTTGADRAIGFVSSGSGTLSGNLYAQFVNNTGASLASLQISYNVEKYRGGSNAAGFRIQMYYSADGSTWTSAGSSFLTSIPADANNNGYSTAPGLTVSVFNQTLPATIANSGNFYLAWNYSVASGNTTTNAQALAVDDISVLGVPAGGGPTNPGGSGIATPSSVTVGNSTTLAATVSAGTNPSSTGLAVACNLSAIGGSSTFSLPSPGFSAAYAVPAGTTAQAYSLPCTVSDTQSRTGSFNIALTVAPIVSTSPSGTGLATPNSVQPGAATLLTVSVIGGTNPASTSFGVSADLSAIGGSATQQFFDNGTNGDVTAGDKVFSFAATVASNVASGSKSLAAAINDDQMRTGSANIALTVQTPPGTNPVKISQVYGGGGNSGSTYTNDFIELYNQSTSTVDISSWSIQQTSATTTTAWNITNLCPANGSCILQPGHYYLVQEAQGTAGTTALPSADITGILNLGAASGKVALVKNTTPISGACPSSNDIADIVGYGGAVPTCFETAAVAALTNTTAAVRKGNGCVDTDNNANDFSIIGPIPRNSSAPANVCGGNAGLPSGVGSAIPASVDPAGNLLLTVTVTPATTPPSTGLGVVGNLSTIGGNASQQFYDDGTHGDTIAGDNVFSFRATAPIPTGAKNIPTTISDAQSRTAPAPITITVQSPTCGVERWAVKTGTDPLAGMVDLNNPVRTTVNALRSIPAPVLNANPPYDPRFAPTENTVFVVNGIMTFYKLEDDVDYHIVLQDTVGNTMVSEIPSPACDGSTSPFDAAVAAVRAKFDARFTATSFFQNANVPVQMKGVGFFDFIHGQTGVAPNGIELHPILDISFTAPSTTTVTSNVNPSTYGQQVTLTATISIATGTPTGVVSFFDSGSLLGTGTLAPNGKATFTTSALNAGQHAITASYEGDSQAAQSASTSSYVLNVNQAVRVITWASPAAIIYGGALGSSQLNATASVPGAFVYTPSAGTVLQVGNAQNLSVVFTPSSSNYAAAAKSVTVDVLPSAILGTPANLIVTRTLERIAGQVVATITIANNGGTSAPNVMLTTAQIGATSGTPLPQSIGTIPPRGALMGVITFPGSVGISGAASTLSLAGTYTGGTFSSGARITLP
jgi:hypothetical protein